LLGGIMDKDKIIKVLKSLPQEFYENAYAIYVNDSIRLIKIQMKYDSDLVIKLKNANKWKYDISDSGFMEFVRDDGLEITMT